MRRPIFFFLLLLTRNLSAQEYYRTDRNSLILDNGFIRREINLAGGKISSQGLFLAGSDDNILGQGKEFSFLLNGKQVDGLSGWKLEGTVPINDFNDGKGVKIVLSHEDNQGIAAQRNAQNTDDKHEHREAEEKTERHLILPFPFSVAPLRSAGC